MKFLICAVDGACSSRLEKLSGRFVSAALEDEDPSTHTQMWASVLCFAKAFSDAVWLRGSQERADTVAKLCKFLRNGCFGSAKVSYPNILPCVTTMPPQLYAASPKTIKDIFNALREGCFSGLAASDASFVTTAYFEVLAYFLRRKIISLESGDIVQAEVADILRIGPATKILFEAARHD